MKQLVFISNKFLHYSNEKYINKSNWSLTFSYIKIISEGGLLRGLNIGTSLKKEMRDVASFTMNM
ncbi:hypothetical protein BCU17_22825 [Vibrio splendidus]|uniref:Uncharacterized protein n=1 Tax=Vibrio splendidus TaxID=29497 RepID=A0A2N7F8Y4_VIBSP|nr:hypothetical protein BCU75_06270 [Vibrio splendidus]PMJ63313.1 hypothetical protein BCU17_22825 [Vibrio splendidus]